MPDHLQFIQFVGFETPLARSVFLPRWEPFAASFLDRGIDRVVLGEGNADGGFRYVSRNVWPEARFRSVFSTRLPGDAGGGSVTAIQVGAFRVDASEGVDLLAARRAAPKCLVLTRCQHDTLGAVVSWLGELGRRHGAGAGWASYAGDPGTRGGRFNAALEVYASEGTIGHVAGQLASALGQKAGLVEERRVQVLREVLALP